VDNTRQIQQNKLNTDLPLSPTTSSEAATATNKKRNALANVAAKKNSLGRQSPSLQPYCYELDMSAGIQQRKLDTTGGGKMPYKVLSSREASKDSNGPRVVNKASESKDGSPKYKQLRLQIDKPAASLQERKQAAGAGGANEPQLTLPHQVQIPVAKDLSPIDQSPVEPAPDSTKSANNANSSIQNSDTHDGETLYVQKATQSKKRYQIIHKQKFRLDSQDKKMFESAQMPKLHQSTNQMINEGSGLQSGGRSHDRMTQDEKIGGSNNEDLHRNQNPLTLLGSQKSLHHAQNGDEHFRLKNKVHTQALAEPALASDDEEERPSGSPTPGSQAYKTIESSKKKLELNNSNQKPSQKGNAILSAPDSNRISQPQSLPSSQKIYSQERFLKGNIVALARDQDASTSNSQNCQEKSPIRNLDTRSIAPRIIKTNQASELSGHR